MIAEGEEKFMFGEEEIDRIEERVRKEIEKDKLNEVGFGTVW